METSINTKYIVYVNYNEKKFFMKLKSHDTYYQTQIRYIIENECDVYIRSNVEIFTEKKDWTIYFGTNEEALEYYNHIKNTIKERIDL